MRDHLAATPEWGPQSRFCPGYRTDTKIYMIDLFFLKTKLYSFLLNYFKIVKIYIIFRTFNFL